MRVRPYEPKQVQPIVSAHPRQHGIAVSVVSHGQGTLVDSLLAQIAAQRDPLVREVIVTHNLRDGSVDPPEQGWPFAFTELFNAQPASFAANHNRAFEQSTAAWFCVLNPDIELPDPAIWRALARALAEPRAGCAYPRLLDPDGKVQDNEREALTPLSLVRRHVFKQGTRRTDWVSGAFWLVRADAWMEVGGLDEGFRMYCEDADFCLRLQLAGWRLVRADAHARHAAARASRQPGRRMAWHVASLLRHWLQPSLRSYLKDPGKARQ